MITLKDVLKTREPAKDAVGTVSVNWAKVAELYPELVWNAAGTRIGLDKSTYIGYHC